MLRLYSLKSFSFCQTLSTCDGLNFKTPRICCIGCSTRLSAIMASTIFTSVTTEQEPVSTLDGSIQKPPPLQVAKRLEKFKTTIFTQMSSLAIKHGAINLGQGFPNFDGPEFVKEAAIQAIRDGKNQYARGYGVPDLNSAVAEHFKKDTGLVVDPEKEVAKRLEKFKTTIFTQMSSLAIKHGSINLGQGFPNFDGPECVKEAAIQAIRDGKNQYARGYGVPDLNSAVAERFKKDTGLVVDPEKEVTVTSGCTEAIAATILGLINPGDEVILFAPFYDSYEATLSMAGAKITCVTLRPPDFSVPIDELRKIVSKDTRAILMNTPHNPTGKMFSREELDAIASLCIEHDILVFSDEVYDKLAFEMDHISIASLPGMYNRTITLNSLGKTFSLTGWKIGWAIAPPHLTWGVRQAHSFLTFATSTPMQNAAATALRAPESYYEELRRDYITKKTILVEGLKSVGFTVFPSRGTYFVVVDHTPFGLENDIAFCEYLIKEVGVVAIPTSVFYLNPEDGKNLVRFTFCKDEGTLKSAVERMKEKLLKKKS